MTAKLLLSPLSLPRSFPTPHSHQHLLCFRTRTRTRTRTRFTVQAFNDVHLFTAPPPPLQENPSSLFSIAAADAGYSLASYYTSLGLFVISVPGLWSLIKRSVKSKIVQKTFVKEGIEGGKKAANQVAGEILSFFTRNNFAVLDRGETITFEGMMVPSRGQAALLTFCTCISLGSIALVLTITVPDVGNNWFWITALSPLAGVYYWTRASRKEQIKVKMMVADDGSLSEIVVQGDDQEVEKMRKELQLSEKAAKMLSPSLSRQFIHLLLWVINTKLHLLIVSSRSTCRIEFSGGWVLKVTLFLSEGSSHVKLRYLKRWSWIQLSRKLRSTITSD